jgi:hypothetical protein
MPIGGSAPKVSEFPRRILYVATAVPVRDVEKMTPRMSLKGVLFRRQNRNVEKLTDECVECSSLSMAAMRHRAPECPAQFATQGTCRRKFRSAARGNQQLQWPRVSAPTRPHAPRRRTSVARTFQNHSIILRPAPEFQAHLGACLAGSGSSELGTNKRRPVSAARRTVLREGPESTLSGHTSRPKAAIEQDATPLFDSQLRCSQPKSRSRQT